MTHYARRYMPMTLVENDPRSINSFEREQIIGYLQSFSRLASHLDIPTKAFDSHKFLKQLELRPDKKTAIIEQLKTLSHLFDYAIQSQETVITDRLELKCVQRALWKYGLFSKNNLETIIQNDQVIEIYNLDQVQIYRNLYFFKLCSYSLFEIMSFEWFELYERPEFITKQLIVEVEQMFRKNSLHECTLPAHLMTEKLPSSEKRTFSTNFKNLIPLYDKSDSAAAFLVTIEASHSLGH